MTCFTTRKLLILTILACFSASLVSSSDIALIDNLPPSMVNYNQNNYIFSGFGETILYNMDSSSGTFIIQDLEAACAVSSSDTPFYPRIFVDNTLGAYYYCASNKSLLILDSTHFAPTGKSVDLSSVPIFNEVRIKTFKAQPNLVTILGLVTSPNHINPNAKNFTQSYFITISSTMKTVAQIQKIQGSHGEPIVGLEAISSGRVLAVGEKAYDCGAKLDTYYIGKWGDTTLNGVIDFYLSTSFVFIPHIQITNDEQYLIYTNDHAIFGFDIPSTYIIQSQDVTLVTYGYTRQDGTQFAWQQIPLSISSKSRQIFVYRQGNLTQFSISSTKSFVEGHSIQVSPLTYNSTTSRFYFYKQEEQDKALIKMSSSLSLFSLSDVSITKDENTNQVISEDEDSEEPEFMADFLGRRIDGY